MDTINKVAPVIDVVLVKISTNNLRTTYIVTYIPPFCDLNTVNIFFDWLLSLDILYNTDILVMGDFNVPLQALSQYQHGFMKGRSTATNLVAITQILGNR